jgi:hypothetical protein
MRWIIVALSLLFAVPVWYRQGFKALILYLVAATLLAAFAIYFIAWLKTRTVSSVASLFVLCALIFSVWLFELGAIRWWIDVCVAVVGFLVAWKLGIPISSTNLTTWRLTSRPQFGARVFIFAIVFWFGTGIADFIFGYGDNRVHLSETSAAVVSPRGAPKVALALSGGGYRAALFHAGVLQQLREMDVPIDIISSVSGGSIFALAIEQGLTPREFVETIIRGGVNLNRAVASPRYLIPAFVEWLIPWNLKRGIMVGMDSPDISRVTINAELLKSAFGSANLYLLERRPPASAIEWIIGSTDVNGSYLVGSTYFGTLLVPIRPWDLSVNPDGTRNTSVYGTPRFEPCPLGIWSEASSLVAAASGAFPLAFESVITYERCRVESLTKEPHWMPFHLVDGGVADNSGTVVLEALTAISTVGADDPNVKRLIPGIIIASDGSSVASMVARRKLGRAGSLETDLYNLTRPSMSTATDAVDFLYTFSGSPFGERDFQGPEILTVSPRLILSSVDSDPRFSMYELDVVRFVELILGISDRDVSLLGTTIANNSQSASEFTSELKTCISKARTGAASREDQTDILIKCLIPTLRPKPGVILDLRRMLGLYADAETLRARFSGGCGRYLQTW